MKISKKRDLILDAMQELMSTSSIQTISVSDIAQKAGIGKGSIYYYFNSKNDIIEAVIERSYSRVLDEGQALAASQDIGAFEKMEIIYQACLDSSLELKRQEALNTFNEQQQSALIHQKFVGIIITRLEPILTDIIRQGIEEGRIRCEFPEETARIILTILTVTLDNSLAPISQEKIIRVLNGFAWMLEESQEIPENTLQFLLEKPQGRTWHP
ncbi:MAG: TetR/AcrR family transcriptional regulator [Lachnospiraceae bacterium]|nr:TetR/AcrR family transcriptional regulator [Lachnospiraceae bacterium]